MVRKFPALILFLCAATVATAAAADPRWTLRKWQTDDGLPNNIVTGLAQTPDGFLWIATPGSLARFDGTQFESLTPSQIVPGYHQNARALLTAHDGSLWMAMAHGPVLHIKTNNVTEIFTNNLPDLVIRRMVEDGDGGIWLIFSAGQWRRIHGGKVQSFSAADGLPNNFIGSIACDRDGAAWFTKGGYIGQFRNGRFHSLKYTEKSQIQLTGARDGGVWGCSGSELFKFKKGGDVQEMGSFRTARPDSTPAQILEDRDGGVWIGTSDSGLFHYTGSGFEHVQTSHPQIICLLQDKEGNIWAGTGGGGLDRIRPCVVRLEGAADGLPFESVESVCQDAGGAFWAVTQNGLLARRAENKWNLVSTNLGWQGQNASCVAADDQGAVWVGAKSELYRFRDGQWKSWGHGDGLIPMRIYALFPATNGDLWVAGSAPESLQRFRNGRWKNFPVPSGSDYIRTIAGDAVGNVWAGTTRGRLLRIRDGRINDETTNVFGIPTSVRGICATPDGCVWFACAGGGLVCLDKDGHAGRVSVEQGLADSYLSQIVADDRGYLWFGSDHGIFKADERALKLVAQGKSSRVQCIQYGPNAGLPGLQANSGHWPSSARGRDGLLWMAMSTGLAVINPRNSGSNSNPPPVLIKRVVMDEKVIADYGRILPAQSPVDLSRARVSLKLPPKHSRLEFDWAALNFSSPENVNFRYQLAGLDAGWTACGTERKADYSRLPAGNYFFKVQARNGDGIWRDSPALAVSVAPFFWQTWWFRAMTVLVFTAVVIAIVRYVSFRRLQRRLLSLEQQAALERERARIARDIHDDLGGSLTQIALLSGMAGRDEQEKAGDYVRRISATTHQVIRSLDEVVWAINPRNDNLCDMLQYTGQFAIEFLTAAGVRCVLDLPEKIPDSPVSAEVRHNFFLVVKETLNNITRHARAGTVTLSAAVSGGGFRMTIADDGQGFKKENADAFANGLRNMQQRMEEIHGSCDIESVFGKGTRVTLSFPAGNSLH